MISCSLMIPNGFSIAMSCRDIGGSGRHPGDTNQRPPLGSQSVQSVRRKLFGDVDHHQTSLDLQRELKQCEERDRNKYNFDFNSEQPIHSSDSRYEWSQISTDSDVSEEKTDFNISTKVCKISDKNIAQSSTITTIQSQSATSLPEESQPGLDSKAVSSVLGSEPSKSSTSATLAPDSQPPSSSSGVELTPKVGQKHKLVNELKQLPITAFFDGRKSAGSQRKRSAAQVLSQKRQRLSECTSAVKPEDIDTTTTDVTDTDVRADEDSVRTTGTPV